MPPHYQLFPRGANSNGTSNSNLSDGAIIIIVLVASGFAVLIGFSITRFYFDKESSDKGRAVNDEQLQYMHSVRRHNLDSLAYSMGMEEGHRSGVSQLSDADLDGGERRPGA
jgi:uncharacterized protein YneF (UPF0154 family)